jgi:hypothetical protein
MVKPFEHIVKCPHKLLQNARTKFIKLYGTAISMSAQLFDDKCPTFPLREKLLLPPQEKKIFFFFFQFYLLLIMFYSLIPEKDSQCTLKSHITSQNQISNTITAESEFFWNFLQLNSQLFSKIPGFFVIIILLSSFSMMLFWCYKKL